MKTTPNVETKTSGPVFYTDADRQATSNATEKISYTKIRKVPQKENPNDGQISSLDCTVEFSFEKERIKAIEHTQLFASLNTVPINQDSVLCSSKMTELIYNNLVKKGKPQSDSKKAKESIANAFRTLCIVLTLFATVSTIAAFFAIMFLSISNMPLSEFILWLCLEIILTILFVIISVKGSNANQFTLQTLNRYFKYLLIYIISLALLLVLIGLQKELTEAFACAMDWADPGNSSEESIAAMVCIVLLCVFFSTVYKMAVIVVYAILCVILRRRLISVVEGDLKANESQRVQCLGGNEVEYK